MNSESLKGCNFISVDLESLKYTTKFNTRGNLNFKIDGKPISANVCQSDIKMRKIYTFDQINFKINLMKFLILILLYVVMDNPGTSSQVCTYIYLF